jgi:hypothetical protein
MIRLRDGGVVPRRAHNPETRVRFSFSLDLNEDDMAYTRDEEIIPQTIAMLLVLVVLLFGIFVMANLMYHQWTAPSAKASVHKEHVVPKKQTKQKQVKKENNQGHVAVVMSPPVFVGF